MIIIQELGDYLLSEEGYVFASVAYHLCYINKCKFSPYIVSFRCPLKSPKFGFVPHKITIPA